MSSNREFNNTFLDWQGENLLAPDGKINDRFAKRLRNEIDRQMRRLYRGLDESDDSDYSVYTGSTGIALLHLHLYHVLDHCRSTHHLEMALDHIEKPLRHLKRRRVTFMCGDAGPLAVGAVIYHKLEMFEDAKDCLKRLQSRHRNVMEDDELPDEFLFGKVGYLFALLFVQHYLGEKSIEKDIIDKVYKKVIESGENMSSREKSQSPLMYEWHEKKYLGAAHGLVGIFHTFMQVKDASYHQYLDIQIKPSIDYMMKLRYPSGNYPSSIGSTTGDKLVHWCHGAPGWLHMFVMAYKTFGEQRYLDEAKSCGEVIWSRGLLKKGYGLCHGVAGNAYGFLTLYRLTDNQVYLFRACKFAEWCFDYGKHGCRTADRPYSLFEGLAGTIYFLADMLDPKNAKFPAFEL